MATATLTKSGYRLPAGMEWMWAAMGAPADGQGGGTNTAGYLKFFAGSAGSNAIGDYAWYTVNSGSKTNSVGTRKPNELGLYDMSGNVSEWCWDWYLSSVPNGTLTGYQGSVPGWFRVLHGGSLTQDESLCTVKLPSCCNPENQNKFIGVRVGVKALSQNGISGLEALHVGVATQPIVIRKEWCMKKRVDTCFLAPLLGIYSISLISFAIQERH